MVFNRASRCLRAFAALGHIDRNLNALRIQEVRERKGQRRRNEEEARLCNESRTEQLQTRRFTKHATYTSVSVSVHTPSTGKHTHSPERQLWRQEQMMGGGGGGQTAGHPNTHISPPTTPSVFKWTTVELLVGRNVKQQRMEPSSWAAQ